MNYIYYMNIKNTIKSKINQVVKDKYKLEDINFQVEYPPQAELGDYSSSVAMALSKKLKKKPLEVGEELVKELKDKYFEKIEVVPPGFINFYLNKETLIKGVDEVLKEEDKYGKGKPEKKLKIQVEFISANPTGPLTLANGRGGFSGDVLANILEMAGHKVEREYYVNNFGEQVRKLGHSILKDKEAEYKGEYIDELNKRLAKEKIDKKDIAQVGIWGAGIILEEMIKPAVARAGIKFDRWFYEKDLHDNGEVDKMLKELKKKKLVYEKDGALWLKTDDNNDEEDKDRVLVKSNGDKTYFAADIAYHFDKFRKRKFDRVINLWGADHHGYVPRMKGAVALLGYPGQLDILLMQLIRLIENGKEVRMSKRKGVYVELEELIDKVGIDVTRFFFLMHSNNKAMDFDLKLAGEKSSKNPVYYVQYAHARICSIIAKTKGHKAGEEKEMEEAEKELIKELLKWPELVSEVAQNYEVHKIPFYAISLADRFHDFYEKVRVIENDQVIKSRVELIRAAKQVLANVLSVLGVGAPEKM